METSRNEVGGIVLNSDEDGKSKHQSVQSSKQLPGLPPSRDSVFIFCILHSKVCLSRPNRAIADNSTLLFVQPAKDFGVPLASREQGLPVVAVRVVPQAFADAMRGEVSFDAL